MDKGHIECAAFIGHPRQQMASWIQQKRQLQGAWQLPVRVDEDVGEGKYMQLNRHTKKGIKKRLSFSFFSKMKVREKDSTIWMNILKAHDKQLVCAYICTCTYICMYMYL